MFHSFTKHHFMSRTRCTALKPSRTRAMPSKRSAVDIGPDRPLTANVGDTIRTVTRAIVTPPLPPTVIAIDFMLDLLRFFQKKCVQSAAPKWTSL